MAKLYTRKSDGTYVPYNPQSITNIDVIQTTGNSVTAAMSQDAVTKELATKQDTLTTGNGISIEGNVIGVTAITESESQPNTSLWLNPSEDEETDVTYNRSQIDAMLGAKQDALQLTVKDNGNIVLSNIQGQSKEFMPATPSGDPMHYYYISLGMEYNNGVFQLNGLNLTASEALETLKSLRIVNQSDRTNGCRQLSIRTNIPDNYATTFTLTSNKIRMYSCFYGIKKLEVVNIANNTNIQYPIVCELNYAFGDCINLKKVIDYIKPINANNAFFNCLSLLSINLVQLSISVSFSNCPLLSSESVLFMVQNEAATSPITITLHADAYARAMANADIVAALQAHPNVSLASA